MDSKHIIRENFNSIDEMLRILNTRKNNEIMQNEHSSKQTGHSNWQGTKTYEEAEELITKGYTKILDEIKSGLKFDATENSKVIPENNVYGYVPNVPNAIMNLPKSMVYQKRTPKKITTVDLVYCPTANCGTDSKVFVTNGIKILNIINSLEKNNIRVNLKAALKCSKCENEYVLVTVTLKGYKEKLNLQKICFPIAHPSMLRRFGFRWLETTKEITCSAWPFGYGSSNVDYSIFDTKEILLGLNDIRGMTEEEIIDKILKRTW